MKQLLCTIRALLLAGTFGAAGSAAIAGTNGFIVPSFRGTPLSQSGYWETFTTAVGAPGNLADAPDATTQAVLTQTNAGAFLTGSGNIYNLSERSAFALADGTPYELGTVVLQTRTIGSELDYGSVWLVYTNGSGTRSLAPLFRSELSRTSGQGFNVSSLWQWDLTGLGVARYTVVFQAAGPSVSFDSLTLDTAAEFIPAFREQPFAVRSAPATLARWNYPFNGNPESRPTASVFGSLGSSPDFDSRDAQYLLGWSLTNRIPAGLGAERYLIRRVTLTLTVAPGSQSPYTGRARDYRSYFPTNDPRRVAPAGGGSPVELFGAGFRGGYEAATYPQNGPWGVNPNGYHTNRVAYAAGFDTNGVLVDVSNNVGDDGTNEIAAPFEVAPFAIGSNPNLVEGQPMPAGASLTFNVNLEDPLIYAYAQRGFNEGNLRFMVTSLIDATMAGPPTYPSFYTSFSPLASPSQVPLLDLEGTIVRPAVDSDGDGLPDDWENFHFGSLAHGSTDDVDEDGASNLAEYQAGTAPTATGDAFKVTSVRRGPGWAEVRFPSAPGRSYSVEWTDDRWNWQTAPPSPLAYSSAWLSKAGINPGYPSPVETIWRDTNATASFRFYRVRTP